MKFLHTADLHLEQGKPHRMDVFTWLIDRATDLQARGIIIAGDLFNSDKDASVLRPQIAALMDRADLTCFVIPGNHDARSYSRGYDYGDNVVQLVEQPFQMVKHEGILLCGVPYGEARFSTILQGLRESPDILIAHGTLYDQTFIFSMLDDIETRYMPILPAHLEGRARYVALGHLHARFIEQTYGDTKVVYPGSPIALDTKCTEPRMCSLVTIEHDSLTVERLCVDIAPYWQRRMFFVFPGIEEQVIDAAISYLGEPALRTVMPHIIVHGYIAEKDRMFKERAMKKLEPHLQGFAGTRIDFDVRSWDDIIQNRLVRDFIDKTEHLDEPLRIKIFELMFPVFTDVMK